MATGGVLGDVVGEPCGGHASLEPPANGGGVSRGRHVGRDGSAGHSDAFRERRSDQHPLARTADAKTPLVEYNVGTSAYRAGKFPQATQAFQKSIKAAPASDARRLSDQEDAYYNLGNTLYRAGQQLEKSAPQEAIQKWTDAVKAYETALQLRGDDADSKYNRDFVKRKIDALRQPPDQGGGGGGGGGGGQVAAGQGGGQGQPPPRKGNRLRRRDNLRRRGNRRRRDNRHLKGNLRRRGNRPSREGQPPPSRRKTRGMTHRRPPGQHAGAAAERRRRQRRIDARPGK